MPKALPRRSKGEKCKEDEDEEKEDKERQMGSEVTRRITAGVLKEADAVGGGVIRITVAVTQ